MDHLQEHQMPETPKLDSLRAQPAPHQSVPTTLNSMTKQSSLGQHVQRQQQSLSLATTSHELVAPLNSIMSYLQMLEKGLCDTPEETADVVRCASDMTQYMFSIVMDVLDSAKAEAGQLSIHLDQVSVTDLINSTLNTTTHEAQNKSILLRVTPFVGDPMIRADARRSRQALTNLVMNAIKYTPIGGHVNIEVVERRELGEVWCEVSDDGPGVAGEDLSKIFDPFHRVGETVSKAPGTGLGLSISRRLVELMGGYIMVHSEKEIGSTFRMSLPIFEEKSPKQWRRAGDGNEGLEPTGPPDGKLALIVEQQHGFRDRVIETLNELGYRTAWALTAEDGMVGFDRLEPDLVFASYGLPHKPPSTYLTGLDLLHAIMDRTASTSSLVLVGGPFYLIKEDLEKANGQSHRTIRWMNKLTLLNSTLQLRETLQRFGSEAQSRAVGDRE